MAIQTGTGKNPKPSGASTNAAATKQGTRPAGETYKTGPNRLTRGGLGAVRKDPITGGELSRTGYGQNQFGSASSAGVAESSKLSDFSIDPPDGDPALDRLVRQGIGYKTPDPPQEEVGQERPISDAPVAPSFGMRSRTAAREGGVVPGKTGAR
jgi:hypothetical protein